MALRFIEPWLNLSMKYAGRIYGGYSLSANGYDIPFSIVAGDNTRYARDVSLELLSDGWLRYTNNSSTSSTRYGGLVYNLPNRGIVAKADTVLFGGFRVRSSVLPVYVFNPAFTGGEIGVSQSAGLAPSHFPNGGMKVNTEYYVEWCLDVSGKALKFRIDGVDIAFQCNFSDAQIAQIIAGQYWVCYAGYGNATGYVIDFKDGYLNEKTEDGIMSGWLGPQTVRKVPVAQATGSWTGTDGASIKDVLNTPVTDAASRLTPLVTSDLEATEATVKLDFSSVQGKVTAVSLNVMARRASGKLGSAEVTITSGGNTSAKQKLIVQPDVQMFTDIQVGGVAPGGAPWTKALLEAAVIKIKPVI